ncbi:MAG: 5-formyltetrahydrofolate cyclo-ligase [Brachyspira sp.]|nr:5-formyltetrahydrofolate cyclo-ligase [Brachyspira sp.]
MDEKSHLRIKFKELRKTFNTPDVSNAISENIRTFEVYKNAGNVLLFYPTRYEINLLSLLSDNKNFFFPRVKGLAMEVCPYSNDVEFKKSEFNINEPCSNPVEPDILDLIFVPALAVDKKGYRLGYGGGYYDRFLPMCKNAVTVVPIFDDFILEKLPNEKFDKSVDLIISNVKRLTIK